MRFFFNCAVCSCLSFLTAVLLMASSACADVRLALPEDVDVLALNGENITMEKNANLPNGVSQLVIRYEGLLYSSDDNTAFPDKVQSAAYVIKFEAADQTLRLIMPAFREDFDVAQFDKKPDIKILTDRGTPVDFEFERLDSKGFAIFRDFARELESFNKTDSPAAVPPVRTETWQARTAQSTTTTAPRPEISASVELVAPEMTSSQQAEATSMSVQMLKFWWQQADAESRKQFMNWIEH